MLQCVFVLIIRTEPYMPIIIFRRKLRSGSRKISFSCFSWKSTVIWEVIAKARYCVFIAIILYICEKTYLLNFRIIKMNIFPKFCYNILFWMCGINLNTMECWIFRRKKIYKINIDGPNISFNFYGVVKILISCLMNFEKRFSTNKTSIKHIILRNKLFYVRL